MNFIGEWCRERCGIGGRCERCSAYCEPRYELAGAVKCSEATIWNLIFCEGYITHPGIADRISDHLCAASEQRDSIVHPSKRGGYVPLCDREAKPRRMLPDVGGASVMKEVVAVDRVGLEVMRFVSIVEAAKKFKTSTEMVSKRCRRKGSASNDEFLAPGVTFRYAAEWDAMSEDERKQDIGRRNFPK